MNCYKVNVVTTNSMCSSTKNPAGKYIECKNSLLFVVCEKPSDVEKVIDPTHIISIELLGVGYAPIIDWGNDD